MKIAIAWCMVLNSEVAKLFSNTTGPTSVYKICSDRGENTWDHNSSYSSCQFESASNSWHAIQDLHYKIIYQQIIVNILFVVNSTLLQKQSGCNLFPLLQSVGQIIKACFCVSVLFCTNVTNLLIKLNCRWKKMNYCQRQTLKHKLVSKSLKANS